MRVCEHSDKFKFRSGRKIDDRYVLLHAIIVASLNLGLCYDEAYKKHIEKESVIPGQSGTGSILLNISTTIKNPTKGGAYMLSELPGNSKMRHSILADPSVELLSWMCVRASTEGFLLCVKSEENIIVKANPWSVYDFTAF